MVSAEPPRPALCLAGPAMVSTASTGASGRDAEVESFGLQPLKTATHLPGKGSPSRTEKEPGGRPCFGEVDKPPTNGVLTIEDRILRITGYYGYYPGYSSHKREDGSDSPAETAGSQAGRAPSHCQSCACTALRVLGSLLVVLSISSSWVGTTQVMKLTFQSFSCPFFMTWFSTNWNILFFPIYYSGHLVTGSPKQTPIQKFRECSRIFGEDGLTLKLFVKRTAPFSILWTLTNYLYLLALRKLSATDVSALYCCHKAFVFLLSWIVLKDRFMGIRIVAAIMAITGIVMMAYADGFHGDSIIGVALAVGSASTSALYKVLFKMFQGSANLGEAAHFFSTLGFFNLIFISCIPLILFFTKVEHWGSFSALPWGYLCGAAGLWLVFNILVNVGVVLTYPILISIGTLLSVPGNAAVDVLKHEVIFSVVRLAASFIICLGFLLLLLPEEWDSMTLRFLSTFAEKKGEEPGEELSESSVHTRSRSRANGAVSIPLA
ncbi:solute carrier family 35 member F4-like isoform X3 [Acipenser ruthenus]|uniref:solute carrier family 35 member F4-like isoform X3 n=1 Tax=Acipenser ruthenus TaxID=7906 RepID=UPI00274245EA|nr:solute carrier family 35 member F4-like isoform X3 [Acipenser ruthenus]XP_058846562.1 solute carrier family 35 member F4-like isoform X3 [Acipenser ruthenus]XP_058846563.1 solute carrier family 35 member F4-like isoform X3 [Acipenser ruthenus]